jgi:hypothetical protein
MSFEDAGDGALVGDELFYISTGAPPRDDGRPSLVAFFLTVNAKF